MQRSRKALLQRRAALRDIGILTRKHLYYKASLLLLSWGIIFGLNSLTNLDIGYRDVLGAVVTESSRHEATAVSKTESKSDDALALTEAISNSNILKETPVSVHAVNHCEHHIGNDNGSYVQSSLGEEFSAIETPILNAKADLEARLQKNGRISRVAPPGLDEFKNKAVTAKEKTISSQTGSVVHRMEPSGKEYNYASSAKGAKVLSFNKDSKGASNILEKDKDKYLRNPCSVEEKYVVIELSEETLVDSLEIANFEHYSSNLKHFELLSSLVYPTDTWVKLGNFTAQNVKHAQRFALPEPKWARYVKLNLLSHYGSEFYCTLSVLEVYGVDAVERMLEDLISVENKRQEPEEQNVEQIPAQESKNGDDVYQEFITEIDYESKIESPKAKVEVLKVNVLDPIENKPSLVGRMPGDAVLKILMQKVQSFDVNLPILERYLEELNSRYGHIFKELDNDIANKDILLDKIRLEIDDIQKSRDVFAYDIGDILSWKLAASSQLDQLVKESAILRSDIEMMRNHQADVENRGLVVIFISFIFGSIAASKLFMDILRFICRMRDSEKFCRTSSAWIALLLSSCIIIFILL